MSAEQALSTADLRSAAQAYKRDAAHKHKWAFGAVESTGRAPGKPRPQRPSHAPLVNDRFHAHFVASSPTPHTMARGGRMTRKADALEGAVSSDDSSSAASASDEYDERDPERASPGPAPDAGVMYSFDAPAAPSQGSQILTLALSRAVERFEERETARLVTAEYDVLGADGETVALGHPRRRAKHGKPSVVVPGAGLDGEAEEDEYEFV